MNKNFYVIFVDGFPFKIMKNLPGAINLAQRLHINKKYNVLVREFDFNDFVSEPLNLPAE